jgi:hypothetical protein
MSQVERTIRSTDDLWAALDWAREMIVRGLRGGEVTLMLTRPKRSSEQNRKMWAMLRDVSDQQRLMINGEMVWADPEDWKDVFTAALRRETRMAMGLDGGVVMLGMRTSKMRKAELSDLIELIYAYAEEWNVRWSTETERLIGDHQEAA